MITLLGLPQCNRRPTLRDRVRSLLRCPELWVVAALVASFVAGMALEQIWHCPVRFWLPGIPGPR